MNFKVEENIGTKMKLDNEKKTMRYSNMLTRVLI